MDHACPPSTVLAAYNAYGTGTAVPELAPAKAMENYRFNNHEGGQEHHWVGQLRYVADLLAGLGALTSAR